MRAVSGPTFDLATFMPASSEDQGVALQRRGRAMRDYRAYILNIDGHRFVWAKEFQNSQPNDAAALNAAKQLTDKHDVEVWEDSRLVARLSPGEGAGLVARLCPA
jgi:hypothetical protein